MPCTVVVFPLVLFVLARTWSVSHVHGYVTPADFVRGRTGSPTLALLVAMSGIVATTPHIALRLVGIEAVLTVMGGRGSLPLIVAVIVIPAKLGGFGEIFAAADALFLYRHSLTGSSPRRAGAP